MMKKFFLLSLVFFIFVLLPCSDTSGKADDGNSVATSSYNTIQLTEKEKSWLAKKHVVRARVGNNPPLHFFDGGNKGICVEYFNLIAELVGLQVEYVHGVSWSDALSNIKNQEVIDLLLTGKKSAERRLYMRFSDDYLLMPWVVFSRTESDFISSINDLNGKIVAVEKNYVMQEILMSEYSTINLLVKNSPVETLHAVASGEADAYIGNLAISTYIINKHNLANLKVASPAPFGNHNQAFVVRNDWPELVSILNKAIVAIPASELSRLRNKWFNVKFDYGISKSDVFKWLGTIVGISAIFLLAFAYRNRTLRLEITKRKKVEEELKEVSLQQKEAVKAANVGLWDWNFQKNKVHFSKEWKNQIGYTDTEISDDSTEWKSRVHPEDLRPTLDAINKSILERKQNHYVEFRFRHKNGSYLWIMAQGSVFEDENGEPVRMVGSHIDITAQKMAENEKDELEHRLQQAQKMEAIGTLAGGIAHDFNNLLGVILGYADLARDDAPPGTDFDKDLEEIYVAANRAKDLVKQILAFSRQTEVEHLHMKLQPLIQESLGMLRSTIPSTIAITADIDPQCGAVLADPSQVHQILMNLCTNAYHAMETTGGTLSVALKTVCIEPDDKNMLLHLLAGEYVKFTVADTGVGIGPDVIPKIFDPYFTTKEVGKGTGMGLAIIHGVMKECGGAITVDSKLGQGAAFHVYFPVVKEVTVPVTQEQEDIPRGTERVLLVDDEPILADMGKDMLERLGYHVTVQYDSSQALEVFQNNPKQFDLVITDQTMPGMTGVDLARKMLAIQAAIPIILCTGYSNLINDESIKGLGIKEFALKPLSKNAIATLIRKALHVI
jgi:PAS domain S-box-containing protein